jgi:hypothetical protein
MDVFYEDVKEFAYHSGVVTFVCKGARIESTVPFVSRFTVALSCGHDISNLWEEDGLSAACWDRCKACDALEESKKKQSSGT